MPNRALRLAAALSAVLVAGAAVGQDGEHPRRGPFVGAAIGESRYEEGVDAVVLCFCVRDRSTGFKLGGGYRFGVTSVEAWLVDFGPADYRPQISGPGSRSRARALVVGPSWTARFGESLEASWRVGAAATRVQGNDRPSNTETRPAFGMSLAWWLAPHTSVELAGDVTRGRNAGNESVDLRLVSLGLRQRF